MDATMAQSDSGPPDWGEVGRWIAAALVAAGGVWAGFRNNWKPPLPPPSKPPVEVGATNIAREGDLAITTLQGLVNTLVGENQRLWARISELEERDEEREKRSTQRDVAMRDLQGQVGRLRALLIRNQIDPGKEG